MIASWTCTQCGYQNNGPECPDSLQTPDETYLGYEDCHCTRCHARHRVTVTITLNFDVHTTVLSKRKTLEGFL